MCGICGIVSLSGGEVSGPALLAMRKALVHRGPDDEGDFYAPGAALGFRRLSILDLETGHQPMSSPDGQVTVVFNGEIYNHPELRQEMERGGFSFRTRADTETLLNLYLRDGAKCVSRLRGMFAFAIWDKRSCTLLAARDQMGIKPFYYSVHAGALYFSSELRSLAKAGMPLNFSQEAVWDYLAFGFVHSPNTVFSGIHKLPPGHLLKLDAKVGMPVIERYYHLNVPESPLDISEDEMLERLDMLLHNAVRSHLLSDVPVGAFLSGGIDSSLITALMCRHASGKVKTFSIGFTGARRGLDESSHARKVARYLGTEHDEIILPEDVLSRVADLMPAMDEPIGDSAILPTFLLSAHAVKKVKVVLSGEGADEIYAGYGRYKAAYVSEKLASMPDMLAKPFALWFKHAGKDKLFRSIPFNGMHDWARATMHSDYHSMMPYVKPSAWEKAPEGFAWLDYVEQGQGFNSILLHDLRTVLADCLLMKVDKATMAASIESRVPFLDLAMVEYALSLPCGVKVRNFKSKWLLRKLAAKYIPGDIAARRKHGFWVPWEEWIKSCPKDVLDAFSAKEFSEQGFFDTAALSSALKALNSGEREVDSGLMFRVAILALWHRSLSCYNRG